VEGGRRVQGKGAGGGAGGVGKVEGGWGGCMVGSGGRGVRGGMEERGLDL